MVTEKKQARAAKSSPVQTNDTATITCKHVKHAANPAQMLRGLKDNKLGVCEDCRLNDTQPDVENDIVWICIKCGHQGCGRNSPEKHAQIHGEMERADLHCIAIEVSSRNLWCYKCDDSLVGAPDGKLKQCIEHLIKLTKSDSDKNPLNVVNNNTDKSRDSVKEKENVSSPTHPQQAQQPRGFRNLGNTCFFNAALQCLCQTPFIIDLIEECKKTNKKLKLKPRYPSCSGDADTTLQYPVDDSLREEGKILASILANRDDEQAFSSNDSYPLVTEMMSRDIELSSQCGPLTSALLAFMKETRQPSKQELSPKALFSQICDKAARFRGFQQQDSHELLRYLLDGVKSEETKRMQIEILKNFKITNLDTSTVDSWIKRQVKAYGRGAKHTLVDSLFGGHFISVITCLECNHMSYIFEPFLDISIPVNEDKIEPKSGKQSKKDGDKTVKEEVNLSEASPKQSKNSLKKSQKKARKEQRRGRWNKSTTSTVQAGDKKKDDDVENDKCGGSEEDTEDENVDQTSEDISANSYENTDASSKQQLDSVKVTTGSDSCVDSKADQARTSDLKINENTNVLQCGTSVIVNSAETLCHSNTDTSISSSSNCLAGHAANDVNDLCQKLEANLTVTEQSQSHSQNQSQNQSQSAPADNKNSGDKIQPHAATDVYDIVAAMECKLQLNEKSVSGVGELVASVDSNLLQSEKQVVENSMSLHLVNSIKPFNETIMNCSTDQVNSLVLNNDDSARNNSFVAPQLNLCQNTVKVQENGLNDTTTISSDMKNDENCISDEVDDLDQTVAYGSDSDEYADPNHVTCEKSLLAKAIIPLSEFKASSNSMQCSVETSLQVFTSVEHLTGANRFCCPRCSKQNNVSDHKKTNSKNASKLTDASKQLYILQPPAVLTLHLKRFQQNGYSLRKISKHINFPLDLDIAPFTSGIWKHIPNSPSEIQYSLFGVVEHSGTMAGGHYVAYVKFSKYPTEKDKHFWMQCLAQHDFSGLKITEVFEKLSSDLRLKGEACEETHVKPTPSEESWYYISDSSVRQCDVSDVLRSQAYMLFYRRQQ